MERKEERGREGEEKVSGSKGKGGEGCPPSWGVWIR